MSLKEQPEWRDVKSYEGRYQVSSTGGVRSLDRVSRGGRRIRGSMLTPRPNVKTGYMIVTLYDGNGADGYKVATVHRLVADAFIPNPQGKPEVNHKDLNRQNNAVENLEWVTTAENGEHRRQSGPVAYATGDRIHTTKLSREDVAAIRIAANAGEGCRSLGRRYGVDHKTISALLRGRTWNHVA